MPRVDPTGGRGYLADPNYYRLGYQLVAQTMHRESAGAARESRRPLFKEAQDILYGKARYPESHRFEARDRALALSAEAGAVLRSYRERRGANWWNLLADELSPKEERLEEFLDRTVLPCLAVVIAASLRSTDPDEAEQTIAPLRQRAELDGSERRRRTISYRALYNLACYEAGSRENAAHARALSYLTAAIEEAPGARRRELRRWAGKDPSLRSLASKPGFQDLVETRP